MLKIARRRRLSDGPTSKGSLFCAGATFSGFMLYLFMMASPIILLSVTPSTPFNEQVHSVRGGEKSQITSEITNEETKNQGQRKALVYPLTIENVQRAKSHLGKLKQAYKAKGRESQFTLRGLGYLYTHQRMTLAGVLPNVIKKGPTKVEIYDVGVLPKQTKNCHLATIWVRINGPEMFAGSARTVWDHDATNACHWEFEFDLQVPGNYQVDAKALVWNGKSKDFDRNAIPVNRDNHISHILNKTSNHIGVLGFDFGERAPQKCSEICTRARGCIYWSTPALHYFQQEGCELYFEESNKNATTPFTFSFPEIGILPTDSNYSATTIAHGPPHGQETSYYLGCGWSFWLNGVSPCLSPDLDDTIFFEKSTFTLKGKADTTQRHLPICDLERHERLDNGRWVKELYPLNSTCPFNYDKEMHYFDKLKHTQFQNFDKDRPHCWYRENITSLSESCFEGGCKVVKEHSWRSSIQQQERWFGTWKNNDCRFLELMSSELQYCVNARKIVDIKVEGGDMADYYRDYLTQQLKHIHMFNSTNTSDDQTLTVVLDALHSPSLISKSNREVSKRILEEKFSQPRHGIERYWVETMYVSSEREPYINAVRVQQFNEDAEAILTPKHFKKISAFDMSAAFTFDSASELDGHHILGPPMKMVITKFLHYMCHMHVSYYE